MMSREGYLKRWSLARRLCGAEAYAENEDAMHRDRQKHREVKAFALYRVRIHLS
jgi:hypothetical protein